MKNRKTRGRSANSKGLRHWIGIEAVGRVVDESD